MDKYERDGQRGAQSESGFEKLGEEVPFDKKAAEAAKSEKMQAYLEEHPEETKNHIVDINEAQLRAEAEDYYQTKASEHLKKAEAIDQYYFGHGGVVTEGELEKASDMLREAEEASERAAERYHDENSVQKRIARMRKTRRPEERK